MYSILIVYPNGEKERTHETERRWETERHWDNETVRAERNGAEAIYLQCSIDGTLKRKSWQTKQDRSPVMRVIPPHRSYNGLARREWQVYVMLGISSMHAHMIFSGTIEEMTEFVASLPLRLQNYY